MRRLAVCISAFEYGGQGTVVEQELAALRSEFDITLFANIVTRPIPDGVRVVTNPLTANPIRQSRALIRQLRQADVIHCHDSLHYMWASDKSGVPWIVTSHGICPIRYRTSSRSRLEGGITHLAYPLLYRRATNVVAISSYIGTWIEHCAHVDALVIYNGVSDVDAAIHQRPEGRSLLYVGEVSRRKGIDRLVYGLKHLPQDVTLTVVGKGAIEYYEDLAAKLSLAGRICFTSEISDAELRSHYQDAFAVISASQWEGFGLPILEGFGHGRPALVRPVGGLRELVDRSQAGHCFSDLTGLRRAFDLVERNWEQLSNSATQFALGQQWSHAFNAYRTLFRQCVDSTK